MASRYTLLSGPSPGRSRDASNGQNNDGCELRTVRYNEQERYDPFTSLPSAPHMSSLPIDDHNHTPDHDDVPASRAPVSEVAHPTSKTAVVTAISLMSRQEYSTKSSSSVNKTSVLRSTLISWMPELVGVAVSIGSLIAIVVILRREDGKPLTAWSLAITLNTVIATLGTLARTTLAFALSACVGQQKWNWLSMRSDQLVVWTRFDEASRGPWGATRLFIWLRARHWAALGALVIIGTVAFDPFLQAVLSTEGRLDNDSQASHEARLPQALLLDAGTIVELSTFGVRRVNTSAGLLVLKGGTTIQPDFGMISAIYNGFHNNTSWDPNSSWDHGEQAVNSVCSTGNCTWPAFTSAAICSSCNDLSDQVVLEQGLGSGGGNIPLPSNMAAAALNYTAFTLRNGNLSNADLSTYKPSKSDQSAGSVVTLLTANTTFDAYETTSFQDLETMISSFVIMKASDEWIEGNVAWNASRPTATECALYLCANMYKAESQNGKLIEETLRSWTIRDPGSYKADPKAKTFEQGPAADAYVAQKGNKLYDWEIQRTDLQLLIPKEESPNVMSFTRTFNVTYAFITTLTKFLMDLTAGSKDIGQMAYPAWDDGMSPLVNALWESNNLTETFNHVARSLTNQARNTAMYSGHWTEASGDTLQWVIHVRVQWAYLAFPIAMITLGVVYVLLTILESTRLHMPVWKESALPSLLHGLDSETQSLLRNAQTQHTGTKPVDTTVRFGFDEKDDCLRLMANQDAVR